MQCRMRGTTTASAPHSKKKRERKEKYTVVYDIKVIQALSSDNSEGRGGMSFADARRQNEREPLLHGGNLPSSHVCFATFHLLLLANY